MLFIWKIVSLFTAKTPFSQFIVFIIANLAFLVKGRKRKINGFMRK